MKALKARLVMIVSIATAISMFSVPLALAAPPSPPPIPSPKVPALPLPPIPEVKVPNAPPLPLPGVPGLEYRILTSVPSRPEHSHVANQGAPALVDVDGNGAPDIAVVFAGPVLRIARVTPSGAETPVGADLAELNLRVQVVAGLLGDPSHTVAFGYDGLQSSAPALFTADVAALPTGSISLDVHVAGAGGSLTVLGALFDGAFTLPSSQWGARSPLIGRLGFAPVPLSARFEVQRADSQIQVTATTTEPTVADVLVEKTTGNLKRTIAARVEDLPTQVSMLVSSAADGLSRIDYTAATPIARITGTLEDRSPATAANPVRKLAVDIRDLPATLSVVPTTDGTGLRSLQYQASAPVPVLAAVLESRSSSSAALAWQAIVDLKSIPARWDLTREGNTYKFASGAPVGIVQAGYATGGRAISRSYNPDYPAHFTNTKTTSGEAMTVRLLGVSQAEVRTSDGFGMMLVQAAEKFRAVISRPNIIATVLVDKLPHVIQIDYIPSIKEVHYTASARIARIDIEATHPTGFFSDARFLTATLKGLPQNFVLRAAAPDSASTGSTGTAIPGPDGKPLPVIDPVGAVQNLSNNDPQNPLDPKPPTGPCAGGTAATTHRGFSFDAGAETLDSLTVTLTNEKGTPISAESTFAASGIDGVLAVLNGTRAHVMGRISKLHRAEFDRVLVDTKCTDDSTDTIGIDTADSRRFKVQVAGETAMITLDLSALVPGVTISHRNLDAKWGGGRELTYRARPGSTTKLTGEVIELGTKIASFTVADIPDYVHVCMMHGPYCSSGLMATTGDLDLSFTASRPVDAYFSTCFSSANCKNGDRSLIVDIPVLERFDVALLAPTACCWADGGVFTDGYLFVDTDNKEFQATVNYKDSTGAKLEAAKATFPAGFKAQDRKVVIAIGADWDGLVTKGSTGNIDCEPSPSIYLWVDMAPNQQMAGELCNG
jgi:hypothetical protein